MPLTTRKQVSVTVRAHDLRRADILSKSDPVCIAAVRNFGEHEPWKKVGETEQIMNNQEPEWMTPFILDWMPGEIQTVSFKVVDVDSHNKDGSLKDTEPLGDCVTTVEAITKADYHGLTLSLTGEGAKPGSRIVIFFEEVSPAVRGTVTLALTARS